MRKVFTLAIVVKDGKVLLGKKMRKIGQGFWNGFGGGVEENETLEQAAVRECEEEVELKPTRMHKGGVLLFTYLDEPLGAKEHEVHVFCVTEFSGTPRATDEMQTPTWFAPGEIPYGEMWEDDQYWLPLLLAGRQFRGEFVFNENKNIIQQFLQEVAVVDN